MPYSKTIWVNLQTRLNAANMTKIEQGISDVTDQTDLNTTHRSSSGTDHSDVVLNNTHRTSDGKNHSDVVLNNTHRVSDGKDHSDVVLNNTHRISDGKDHADVVLNNTHRSSDGKDHSDVVLNNTHRTSDGKDHSDVVLNNTHRTSDGKDHSDVVLNNTHRTSDGKDHSDVVLNNTHRTSNGTDHTYIDQDIRTTASPTFAGLTVGGDKISSPSQSESLRAYSKFYAWSDICKIWEPSRFNQQWGGNNLPISLPSGVVVDAAVTNFMWSGTGADVGNSAAFTYRFQGFTPTNSISVDSIILPILKEANPTNNYSVWIYSDDGSGKPSALITNGTATAQSGKLHSPSVVLTRFVFATPPTLVGGTKYHIVCASSGTVDATNYWRWMRMNGGGAYQLGRSGYGNATPTWTLDTVGYIFAFAIVPTAATSFLTTNGLALGPDRGLMSKFPLYRYADHTGAVSIPIRAAIAAADKDSTLFDVGVSPDRSRIRLSVTAAGYLQADVWENDGTKHTLTGSTDVCDGTERLYTLMFRGAGDGSDFIHIYSDATEQGSGETAQTITFDTRLKNKYIMLGWGWSTAPTWTLNASDTTNLWSNAANGAWTWTGTATEANANYPGNGWNTQVGSGYASTDTGYNVKANTCVNATGHTSVTDIQVITDANIPGESTYEISIRDNAKDARYLFHEYFGEFYDGTNWYYFQYDFKSNPVDLIITCKGSDTKLFSDGKLLFDGTGLLLSASSANNNVVGDTDATAASNATVRRSYFKQYEGLYIPDEFSVSTLSEVAFIERQVDAVFLSDLYNLGTRIKVKEYLGIGDDYWLSGGYTKSIEKRGIVSLPTTTDTSLPPTVILTDLTAFTLMPASLWSSVTLYNSAAGSLYTIIRDNGIALNPSYAGFTVSSAGYLADITGLSKKTTVGISFCNVAWRTSTGTATANAQRLLRIDEE